LVLWFFGFLVVFWFFGCFILFFILFLSSICFVEEEEATEDIEEIDLRSADFMLSHNIQDLMDTTSRYFEERERGKRKEGFEIDLRSANFMLSHNIQDLMASIRRKGEGREGRGR
jgi:hypothetical protein